MAIGRLAAAVKGSSPPGVQRRSAGVSIFLDRHLDRPGAGEQGLCAAVAVELRRSSR